MQELVFFICLFSYFIYLFLLGRVVQAAGGPTEVQIGTGFIRPLCPRGLSKPGSCCA